MTLVLVAVFPDFSGVTGSGQLRAVVGALLSIVLITAVLMLILSAITWAIATAHGNYHAATRARAGLFVAIAGAVLAGAAVGWLNFLLNVGSSL